MSFVIAVTILGVMAWGIATFWYRASSDPRKIEVPRWLAQISRGTVNPTENTIEVASFSFQLMAILIIVWTILVAIVMSPSEERVNIWQAGNIIIFLSVCVFMAIWLRLDRRKNRDR